MGVYDMIQNVHINERKRCICVSCFLSSEAVCCNNKEFICGRSLLFKSYSEVEKALRLFKANKDTKWHLVFLETTPQKRHTVIRGQALKSRCHCNSAFTPEVKNEVCDSIKIASSKQIIERK